MIDYRNKNKTALQAWQQETIQETGRAVVNETGYPVGSIGFANAIVSVCEETFTFYRMRPEFKHALEVAAFKITSLPGFLKYDAHSETNPINDPAEAALLVASVLRPIIEGIK